MDALDAALEQSVQRAMDGAVRRVRVVLVLSAAMLLDLPTRRRRHCISLRLSHRRYRDSIAVETALDPAFVSREWKKSA